MAFQPRRTGNAKVDEVIDEVYKLLNQAFSKVSKLEKQNTGNNLSIPGFILIGSYAYWGDPATDGSWRLYVAGDGDLVADKRISGVWVEKNRFMS